MRNKYKGLNNKSPEEAAKVVGEVEKSNYLAHSIREIQQAILRNKGENYHIISRIVGAGSSTSKVFFFNKGCEIFLPHECEEMDDKKIRLILAHELGHIVFNIENLMNPEILENTEASNEEEFYAWKFAFNLIKMKSDEHRSNSRQSKFIYHDDDLKSQLSALVKSKKPEIYNDVVKSLNLPKF